jgi:ubiquinone/menaquinone biosynthesis C-methylase UbiE
MLGKSQYATSEKFDSRIYLNAKFKTNPKSFFKRIFEHFPKDENLKVLEMGCGTGLFWMANRNEIPESWSIMLSDYSEGMLDGTRKALSGINRNFQYRVLDAGNNDFPDKSFDIILANNMLYHVDDRPAALSHISRTLKDDGVFIAATMGKKDMMELDSLLYDFLSNLKKNFRFREKGFSIENGFDQIKAFFPNVKIERYEDVLKIDEIEPVIRYYLSFNGMYDGLEILPQENVNAFRKYLLNVLNDRKVISVTKDKGIFICSKMKI